MTMTNPALPPPAPGVSRACIICGRSGTLQQRSETVRRPRRTNHILHLLLGLPTLGVWWWTVWPVITIVHKVSRGQVVGHRLYIVCTACGARQV